MLLCVRLHPALHTGVSWLVSPLPLNTEDKLTHEVESSVGAALIYQICDARSDHLIGEPRFGPEIAAGARTKRPLTSSWSDTHQGRAVCPRGRSVCPYRHLRAEGRADQLAEAPLIAQRMR